MASVELSYDQILQAARQLPAAERNNLVKALEARPSPDEILKVARRLRPKFRLSPSKRRRMDRLVDKRSEGTLTATERAELDALVEEIDENTLRMSQAIEDWVKTTTRQRQAANGASGE